MHWNDKWLSIDQNHRAGGWLQRVAPLKTRIWLRFANSVRKTQSKFSMMMMPLNCCMGTNGETRTRHTHLQHDTVFQRLLNVHNSSPHFFNGLHLHNSSLLHLHNSSILHGLPSSRRGAFLLEHHQELLICWEAFLCVFNQGFPSWISWVFATFFMGSPSCCFEVALEDSNGLIKLGNLHQFLLSMP